MTGYTAAQITLKRKDQAVTLERKVKVKVGKEVIQCTNDLLFQRLILLAQKSVVDLPITFTYELNTQPSSLFAEDGYMRDATKHILAEKLRKMSNTASAEDLPENVKYILDGGALLQRLPWPSSATYSQVFDLYEKYIRRKYGTPVIVFDGYSNGPSTKKEVHRKRTAHAAVTTTFEPHMQISMKKNVFLGNAQNKQRFIEKLCEHLESKHLSTRQATSDADVLIVETALGMAETQPTVVVGDDADLLILLLHYTNDQHMDTFLRPEPKQTSKHVYIYDIRAMQSKPGATVTKHILFIYAILGCDTISRLYGIGKSSSVDMIRKNELFQVQADIFETADMEHEAITRAGEIAIALLYKAHPNTNLNFIRLQMFMEKVAKCTTVVSPEKLPPTSSAAKFHSYRIYHQIQEWKGNHIDPLQWGWKQQGEVLVPIKTDIPPAPENLLSVIHCGCTTECSERSRCSCLRHGVQCSTLCSECKRVSCSNTTHLDDE